MRTVTYKLRFSLFFLGAFIFSDSYCQTNYLPGYIVNLNGDTTKGFINYRNWEINPREISFKQNPDGSSLNFNPLTIKGFGVLDEIYTSAAVEKEISFYSTDNLQHNAHLQIESDTVFLQTLFNGVKSLFVNTYKKEEPQFYIKQDTMFKLLIYKKYLKLEDNKSVVIENKNYLGQLTLYLAGCKNIQSKLKNTRYNKTGLENLFSYFYACTDSEISFQRKSEKAKIEFGLLGGISNTTIKFESEEYPYLVNTKFNSSNNFSGGVFLDLVLPRNWRKWSVYSDLIYTKFALSGHFDDNYHPANIKLGYSYLKLNNVTF